jgi:hypothetical protein
MQNYTILIDEQQRNILHKAMQMYIAIDRGDAPDEFGCDVSDMLTKMLDKDLTTTGLNSFVL